MAKQRYSNPGSQRVVSAMKGKADGSGNPALKARIMGTRQKVLGKLGEYATQSLTHAKRKGAYPYPKPEVMSMAELRVVVAAGLTKDDKPTGSVKAAVDKMKEMHLGNHAGGGEQHRDDHGRWD